MDQESERAAEHQQHTELLSDRRAFLARCSAVPGYRAHAESIREAIDLLIAWSARHPAVLSFSPASDLDQDSVAFRRRSDGNVFWKAYPGGPSSEPFVEFFTRAHAYLPDAAYAELTTRWRALPGMAARPARAGEVMRLPLRALARAPVRQAVVALLDWAAAPSSARG